MVKMDVMAECHMATAVVNHRAEGYLEAACAALPADKGGLFDVVLEMAADRNLLSDLRVARAGARVAIIGSKPQDVALNPRLLMPKEISLHGVFLSTATAEERASTHRALYEAMEQGGLAPIVAKAFPLEEAREAHKEVVDAAAGGKAGNVVVVVKEEE